LGTWSKTIRIREKESYSPKVLESKVIQYGVREKMIRGIEEIEVECYKCREKGHKCREYLL